MKSFSNSSRRRIVKAFAGCVIALLWISPPAVAAASAPKYVVRYAPHTARLKDIHQSTLFLVGDDENHGATVNTHWAAPHQLTKAIPRAKLVVLAGEGHHYLATNPDAAHQAIRDFIRSNCLQ
jgi:pimeloyl-ACP methyl ester carboxylesterase